MKEEEYLKQTELRKAKNYNFRMDTWVKSGRDANRIVLWVVIIIFILGIIASIFE